jgi:putative FmdB family regulatory protein
MGQDERMARYDFRCRTCDSMFEVERPMAQSNEPAVCPDGHTETVQLLSRIAVLAGATPGRVGGNAPAATPMAGGCGGGCACAH